MRFRGRETIEQFGTSVYKASNAYPSHFHEKHLLAAFPIERAMNFNHLFFQAYWNIQIFRCESIDRTRSLYFVNLSGGLFEPLSSWETFSSIPDFRGYIFYDCGNRPDLSMCPLTRNLHKYLIFIPVSVRVRFVHRSFDFPDFETSRDTASKLCVSIRWVPFFFHVPALGLDSALATIQRHVSMMLAHR